MSAITHRAAVLGKPVGHSLSPVLHRAGYAATGLTGWAYTAIECAEDELSALVGGLSAEWVGLSLTMPLKQQALRVACEVDPLAAALGAANTLVRRGSGWCALNTDVPGMVDALAAVGCTSADRVAVLGAGGTARAALAAASALGADEVVLYARRPAAVAELRPVIEHLGLTVVHRDFADATEAARMADVVISTVPAGAADRLDVAWRPGAVLFDVLYHPWPTPLATSAQAAGCRIVSGLDLLLAQAVHQFVLFTGVPAPVSAMRDALLTVTGGACQTG